MRNVDKALRFPLGGVADNLNYRDTTYPSEDSVYSTPMASNVIGECSFSSRMRGGSRPGLKAFSGAQPQLKNSKKWMWPNGEVIEWPGGQEMTFAIDAKTITPDGSLIVDQHESFSVAATKGNVPTQITAFALYRDRFVVAGGNAWYASRTSDHGDFDFGGEQEDPTRPMAGTISLSGNEGEAITAVIPVADQRLYIATSRRLCAIQGEPTTGMSTISEFVGVISRNAWCNADGTVYFVGENGLYAVGDGSPINVSSQIPETLKGLSSAVLVYDPERKSIHMFCERGQTHSDWFYDIDNKAFWPIVYSNSIRPTMGGTAMIGGVDRVIFKCQDNVWRFWDEDTKTDAGVVFASMVTIGPFKCGTRDDIDGMLDKLTVTLEDDSDGVSIFAFMGKSAESALAKSTNPQASPDFTGTASGGWNCNVYARCRGAWCVLQIASQGKWAYESVTARTKVLGGLRYV